MIDGYPPGTNEDEVRRVWEQHGVFSREDAHLVHQEIDLEFGTDEGCGGTSHPYPCGGCVDCIHAQVRYSFFLGKQKADLYHKAGLEWAPYVIDEWKVVTHGGGRAMFHNETKGPCRERESVS